MNKPNEITNDFWRNKTIVSFFLAVFVVALHIDTFNYYPEDGTTITLINDSFSTSAWALNQIAVPLFYIMTAAVFFHNYNNSVYVKKLKSRVKTLVIPYFIWNFLGTVCACILWQSHREMFFTGDAQKLALNWFEAIFHFKCYVPFFFIFNIFIFYLAAPLIDLILRNKYASAAVIVFLILGQNYGVGIPASVFYRSDSVIYLLIGSFIGRYYFTEFAGVINRRKAACAVVGLLVYLVGINLYAFKIINISLAGYCVLTSFGAISFWFVCSGLICPNMKYRPIYGNSFAMYAMHFYLNYVFARGIYKLLPNPIWAIPNFIITLLATVFTIRAFCVICERLLPTVYSVIMGERKAV